MTQWLIRRWYSDSAPLLLRPLSALYAAIIAVRRLAYERGWLRSHRVQCPVLIVGNLTVGGTGKTPLVIWLAQQLAARGHRVGILSRGYGRKRAEPHLVHARSDWREVGDEPLLLHGATGCPTAVGADRVAAARMLTEQNVELIISDDGLQHLRLARDCEILVIDGERGFGNGSLLPAGPLREPASRMASVDAVVVNGDTSDGSKLRMSLVPGPPQALVRQGSGPLPGKVHAVAGIGNPQRFFRMLRAQGFEVVEHAFPDHYAFTAADVRFNDDLPVLMTEKDAVKCREFADSRLWSVPVTVKFNEAQARELLGRVLRKLRLNTKG